MLTSPQLRLFILLIFIEYLLGASDWTHLTISDDISALRKDAI